MIMWITYLIHNSHSVKMDTSTLADITQLSYFPKHMWFLFLLEIFKQKQTRPVCLYIMSIQPQHFSNRRDMFNSMFGCLKSPFWRKLSCKATSIPRIIGAGFVHNGYVHIISLKAELFRRNCIRFSKPAKYKKLKCQIKLHFFVWG